jgi:hypothetical protein
LQYELRGGVCEARHAGIIHIHNTKHRTGKRGKREIDRERERERERARDRRGKEGE